MKRIFISSLFLLVIVAGAIYFYFSQALSPRAVPDRVVVAENAIASLGTIAIASIDMDYVNRITDTLYGEPDPSPILSPTSDNILFGDLIKKGINPIKQTEYALAAFNVNDKSTGFIVVLFGDYSVDTVKQHIRDEYSILEEGDLFWTIQKNMSKSIKSDPCAVSVDSKSKKKESVAINIEKGIITIASPGIMPVFLQRFKEHAQEGVDLTQWRKFRSDKLIAGAVISPKEVNKGASGFASSILLGGTSKQPLKSIYAGTVVKLLPPQGLIVLVDAHSLNSEWPNEKKLAFDKWQSEAKSNLQDIPSLASLFNSLSFGVDDNILRMKAIADENTLANIDKIPGEFIRMIFSGFNMKGGNSAPSSPNEEKILAEKDIPKYINNFSLSSIPSFDDNDSFYKAHAISGPFAVRISEIGLLQTDESILQLVVKAEGNGFENIPSESMHMDAGHSPISIKILAANGKNGNNLLREGECGKDRNIDPKELTTTKNNKYENGKWVTRGIKASGNKKIRLKKNITLAQLDRVEGELRVELATQTKTVSLKKPFNGKVIETNHVRMYLKDSSENTIKYDLSGKIHHILAILAKNDKGQYLANGGSSSTRDKERKTISKTVKGKIASIEIVYATKIDTKVYPFVISEIMPKYGNKSSQSKLRIQSISKQAFLKKYKHQQYEKDCLKKPKTNVGPFLLCLDEFGTRWGSQIGGSFKVYAPKARSLQHSINSIELSIDTVIDKNAVEWEFKTNEKSEFSSYYSDSNFDKNKNKWIKTNERLGANYVQVYKDKKEFESKEIDRIKGTLKIRIPKEIHEISLDADRLGQEVNSESNIVAKITKFEDWSTYIDLQGPVEKIVQLGAQDKDGAELGTGNDRVVEKQYNTWHLSKEEKEKIERKPPTWEGMITIYGKPERLKIRYANDFDIMEYPFEFDLTKKVQQEPIKGQKSVSIKKRVSRTSSYNKTTKESDLKKIPEKNILLNGDFEKKLSHWTVKDPVALAVGKGIEDSNALFMNAPYIAPSKYIYELTASECVKINDAVRFSVEAMFQYDSLPIKRSGHRLNLYWYEDENCSQGGQYGTYLEPKLKLGWQKVRKDSINSSLNASSVKILATQNQRSSAKATTSLNETPTLASAYWDNIKIIATHIPSVNKEDSNMTNKHTLPLGENYIKNGSFDKNIENWRTPVAIAWSKDEGKEKAGAIRTTLESTSGSIGMWAFSQCVNFGSQDYFEMGANYKHDKTSTQKGGGRLRVAWYEHEDCEGRSSSSIKHVNPKQIDGWQALKVTDLKAAKGSKSANIDIVKSIHGKGTHSAYWDDIYFKAVSQK